MQSDIEILKNRIIAVKHLQKRSLKKTKMTLRDSKGGRCCLGHICDALKVPYKRFRNYENSAWQYRYGIDDDNSATKLPYYVAKELGFFTVSGYTQNYFIYQIGEESRYSLANFNDTTNLGPNSIGKYLFTNILGGDATPWKRLNVSQKELDALLKEYEEGAEWTKLN